MIKILAAIGLGHRLLSKTPEVRDLFGLYLEDVLLKKGNRYVGEPTLKKEFEAYRSAREM